jgi:hypothetical protein
MTADETNMVFYDAHFICAGMRAYSRETARAEKNSLPLHTDSNHECFVAEILFAQGGVALHVGVALLRLAPAPSPASKIFLCFGSINDFHQYQSRRGFYTILQKTDFHKLQFSPVNYSCSFTDRLTDGFSHAIITSIR